MVRPVGSGLVVNPPQWSVDLVAVVCASRGRRPPELSWSRSLRSFQSSGHYSPQRHRVHVTAGGSELDQRLVVLHEVAHHLERARKRPSGRQRRHHTARFWTTAFDLYQEFGGDELVEYAIRRESEYLRGAAREVDRRSQESA